MSSDNVAVTLYVVAFLIILTLILNTNTISQVQISNDNLVTNSHDGDDYFSKYFVDFTGGENEEKYFIFITPNESYEVHGNVRFYGDVEYEIIIMENVSVTSNGTLLSTFNNDRTQPSGELLSFYDPIGISGGINIWEAKLGSGKTSTGFTPGLNYNFILVPDTIYAFNITKIAVQTGYVDFDYFWWEEPQ